MTRAERDAWVAALRSGKYKQGDGWLRFNDEYCCLGVKFDLDGVAWEKLETGAYDSPADGAQYPSDETLQRWGLSGEAMCEAATMNDCGRTFAEIADWIEANVPVTD